MLQKYADLRNVSFVKLNFLEVSLFKLSNFDILIKVEETHITNNK
jgi:hypothetical protein